MQTSGVPLEYNTKMTVSCNKKQIKSLDIDGIIDFTHLIYKELATFKFY